MPKAVAQSPKSSVGSGVISRIHALQPPTCGLKICLYGQSGKGKTSIACTFPTPILLIRSSGESRRKSVFKLPGGETVCPSSVDELNQLADYQAETNKYKTVVVDHITEFQDVILKQVLGVEEIPAQIGWGDVAQSQWGEVGLYMKEWLRRYVALNCHIILIAQERDFNSDGKSDILDPYVGPAVSPTVAGWIGPSVDYLLQAFTRQIKEPYQQVVGGKNVTMTRDVVQYCLRTGPHPVYNTKFTVPRGVPVPDVIVDPTYEKIVKIIDGGK